ncbi:MAG: Uncharacterized MFS-type transporter, partial [uncultured Solirubrobacteraceae bacterium]
GAYRDRRGSAAVERGGFALRLAALGRRGLPRHGRRGGHVVGRRRAARGAGRIRRRPRRRVAALHPRHPRLGGGRRADGAARRPLRRGGAGRHRQRLARVGLSGCGPDGEPAAVLLDVRRDDRAARDGGRVRAAGGGHVALVQPPARHRRRALRQRKLLRRRGVAAGDPALRGNRRVAADPHGDRAVLPRRHAAADFGAAPPAAFDRACRGRRRGCRRPG